MEKDVLKPFGYEHVESMTKSARQSALKKAIKAVKPLSIYRRIIAIATLNKNKDAKLYNILREDADWIKSQPEYLAKKASKKSSKKSSKTGKMKRTLNPKMKAIQVMNEKILKEVGAERTYWFGLITYVNMLRKEAKKSVKDETDTESVNKKIMELFEKDLQSKGKGKIASMIKTFAEEAKAKKMKGKK